MTDIVKQKMQTLLDEARIGIPLASEWAIQNVALRRAIEQHEAFRQEVSDAVEVSLRLTQGFEGTDAFKAKVILERFIIAKPDPLVEVLEEASGTNDPVEWANRFYAAIEKRGGKIVWGEG